MGVDCVAMQTLRSKHRDSLQPISSSISPTTLEQSTHTEKIRLQIGPFVENLDERKGIIIRCNIIRRTDFQCVGGGGNVVADKVSHCIVQPTPRRTFRLVFRNVCGRQNCAHAQPASMRTPNAVRCCCDNGKHHTDGGDNRIAESEMSDFIINVRGWVFVCVSACLFGCAMCVLINGQR